METEFNENIEKIEESKPSIFNNNPSKESRIFGISGLVLFVVLGGMGYCPWYMWIFVVILALVTLSGLYKKFQIGCAILVILFATPIFNFEAEEDYNKSSYSSSYSSNKKTTKNGLSQYVGSWKLHQNGNGVGEFATLKITINSNGSARLSHWASGFGHDTLLAEGSGTATLSGSTLTIEITSGKSRGTTYTFDAFSGKLYFGGSQLSKQ